MSFGTKVLFKTFNCIYIDFKEQYSNDGNNESEPNYGKLIELKRTLLLSLLLGFLFSPICSIFITMCEEKVYKILYKHSQAPD